MWLAPCLRLCCWLGYNLHYFGTLLVLGQMNIGGAAEASAQLPAEFTLIPIAMAAPARV